MVIIVLIQLLNDLMEFELSMILLGLYGIDLCNQLQLLGLGSLINFSSYHIMVLL